MRREKFLNTFVKTRRKGASLLKWFQTVKAARHYLLDIPDVRRNHTLLFFPLQIISVREIYSDSLFQSIVWIFKDDNYVLNF